VNALIEEQSVNADAQIQAGRFPAIWQSVMRRGLASWVHAPAARAVWWQHGARGLPLTVSVPGPHGPWTTSAGTMFGAMTVEEASRLQSPLTRASARAAGPALSRIARVLDPIVNIGTYATSTYLHEADDPDLIREAAAASQAAWLKHVPVVRSLDAVRTPSTLRALAHDGWLIVPSRQVWYYTPDDPRLRQKRELRHDQRLLDRTTLVRRALVPADANDVVPLYAQLYLGKYSRWNPELQVEGIRAQLQTGGLTGEGFELNGVLVAVALYIDAAGIMTTPVLGYDLSLPRALGLYRLLSMIILERGLQRGLLVHASAGADEFKFLRGATPALEYVAVDVRGRPRYRAAVWQAFAAASNAMASGLFTYGTRHAQAGHGGRLPTEL
jgi:hypothetical protein